MKRAHVTIFALLVTVAFAAGALAYPAGPAAMPSSLTAGDPPVAGATAVAAGDRFTCVVTAAGGVQCWGYNGSGVLGDGTYAARPTPADVVGLTSGAAGVSAGFYHVCAVTSGGGVKCWGYNDSGQLGDGTRTQRTTPVGVYGLTSGVVAVAAGTDHTCALTSGGGVKCWGSNAYGRLGDGGGMQRTTPVDVVGLTSGVVAIAAGYSHTCALTSGGGVKCWGDNWRGQLGDGTTTYRTTPVDVSGLTSGVVAIASGSYADHTCAVTSAGGVKCWGSNNYGELGDGTSTQRLTPVDVTGLTSGVLSVAAGYEHTCTVISGGGVKCWGANFAGQLGDGTTSQRLAPVDVSNLGDSASVVAAGNDHTCLLEADGSVQCWGSDANGQLGVAGTLAILTPADVAGVASGTSALSAGSSHNCVVTTAGGVKCWGLNERGPLGLGERIVTTPATLAGVSGLTARVTAAASGASHTCALTNGGGVKCWGLNFYGQLGNGSFTQRAAPVDVSGLTSGAVSVAAGYYHTCALLANGGLKCWGDNSYGQLGDGTISPRTTPIDVSGLTTGVVAVAAGDYHTCAVMSGGGVRCWGQNSRGQLGDGTTTQRTTPVDVSGATGMTAVAGGGSHTCALTTGGGMKCWGQGAQGQLGDGTSTNRSTPVDVSGLASDVAAMSLGAAHTCAVTASGGLKCWGNNTYGQLGDGTTVARSTPSDVSTMGSGVAAVAASSSHTCALTTAGGVKCWGDDSSGQVGVGRDMLRMWPSNASGFGVTLTLGGLLQAYDGSPKPVTVSSIPSGVTVTITYTGINGTTYGPSESAPSALGNYSVFAVVTDPVYSGSGSTTATLTIANAAPVVTGITPPAGPDSGGTPITITGTGFVPGVAVEIGGVSVTVNYVNSTTITAVTPPGAGGLVATVVVRNPAPNLGEGTGTFTYLVSPKIVSISPTWGPVGTVTTITGTGFSATDAAVSFGGVAATVTNRSATQIIASVPPGLASGPADVTVTNVGYGLSRTYLRLFTVADQQPVGASGIAAGYQFTCAVTAVGGVQCWGSNSYGKLGDGASFDRATAADVTGLTSGATAITTGVYHACALTANGGVKCWGANFAGQLGDGTTTTRNTPVDVSGLTVGVVAVAAGEAHTCALTSGGGVKCWGNNSYGQLGDGTTTSRGAAADVTGLTSGVVAIATSYRHTCALTSGGGVKCWGYNYFGQLGDGTTTSLTSAPADVTGLASGVLAVTAAYYHTCALTVGGGVKCWGLNSSGELGDGTTTSRTVPGDVSGLTTTVVAVTAGCARTCAVTTDGGVKCWGINGQLGDATASQRATPVDVVGLAHAVSAIAAGYDQTCVLATDGGVQCWGGDTYGQLGVGRNLMGVTPSDVPALPSGASVLAAGPSHSCVVTGGGGVKCWGNGSSGQLGDGTNSTRATPVVVSGLAGGAGKLALGGQHTCAVTSRGGVKCWGYNYYSQLGDGTTTARYAPVDVNGLTSGVVAVAAGSYHTCALTGSGGVKCWGQNYNGQLGDATTTNRSLPVDVTGLTSGVIAIAAGSFHTCAVTGVGGVKCWGSNSNSQLGDGTTTQRAAPVDVSGLTSGVVAVAAASSHTCALTSGGGVKCWGANWYGQLGDGTTTQRATPVDVSGLTSGVSALTTCNSGSHTCAAASGGVKCWGLNTNGQLGDGTTTSRLTPTDVTGLTTGISALAAGGWHTCALTADGHVKCWGSNTSGQLGDGSALFRTAPATVTGFGVTITFASLEQVNDGAPKSVTVTTTPSGQAVTVTYTGTGGTAYGPTQTPPTDAGTYSVLGVVSGPPSSGSSSATLTIYNPTPTITSITPPSGPDTGGTAITIAGTDFRPGASVTIGGSPVSSVWVNSMTLTAVTPSTMVPGAATVVVSNPSPTFDVASATFTYLAYPQVTSLSPTHGTAGTVVTISGRNFSAADSAVWFGAQPAVVNSRSATQIVAVVPAGLSSGVVDVTVSNVGQGLTSTYPRAFTIGSSPATTGVAAGPTFTCAVIGGGAKCWGHNYYGLGDGTTATRVAPGDVAGLTSGVAAVTTGYYHACALTMSGGVKCWGDNGFGQLGDGSYTNQSTPVDVAGLGSGVTAIVAGSDHTCALTSSGGVKCWGDNYYGQLGDGTTDSDGTPADVTGLSGVVALAAGGTHTCALTSGGVVKCWGDNSYGQLGDGTTTGRSVAIDVPAISNATALAAGYYHTCAATSGGAVACWGWGQYGQLGDGTTNDSATPVSVNGLTDAATALTAGLYHTCALLADGSVQCWGSGISGELGDGTMNDRTVAAGKTFTGGVVGVVSGPTAVHTCAILEAGGLKCWGSNSYGQLASGSDPIRTEPVDMVLPGGSAARVAGGPYYSCVLTSGGGVKCSGSNSYGQLGNGSTIRSGNLVDTVGLAQGASAMATGGFHACAVTSGGGVRCWGYNSFGQLGDTTTMDRAMPVPVSGLGSGAVAVAAGNSHSCALTTAGGVKCWGVNSSGQLGDATTTQRTAPVDVSGLTSGVVAVAAGDYHTCALTATGGVKCWGSNYYGQLGDGTTTQRTTPVDVVGLPAGITAINAGYGHTCALTSAGSVKCWGFNTYGQLGDGTTSQRTAPIDVSGLTSAVVALAAGYGHSCAVMSNGGVKCWGRNIDGQLGDGTTSQRTAPTDVNGLTSGVVAVSAGFGHSCAVMSSGAVKCWGFDGYGQLGDGRLLFTTVPLDVTGLGKSTATVVLGNLTQVADGAPRAVTVTTVPSGLSANVTYAGTANTTYGRSATPPSAAGAYSVTATIADETYQGMAIDTLTIDNPMPIIGTLAPASRAPGSGAFTLTVNGTQFVQGATVFWNGTPRTTTFVSASELRAAIDAADVATPGSAAVTVENAMPAIAASAPVTFAIRAGGGVIPGDVNGDGSAEVVIYRARSGEWWVRGAAGAAPVFGTPTDLPVVADYNGDGQADIAVWRPATGEWLIKDQTTVVLGGAGDIPVPGDYNGDGKAEVAVFHARTGVWEFVGLSSITLGQPGDVPVPGDYNGDGIVEPAVYRRATGTWLFADQTTIGWGGPGDIAVPGDYNGDGTTDVAIYRPSTGDWYVRNGVHVAWGAPGDVPVPLDVDGDGRAEIIVYRPATGAWFIYHTESSLSETVMWGGAGDVPIGQQPLRPQLGANDLDGDGRSDVTIFRPGTGQWFTLGSASGFTQWTGTVLGEAGDIPLVGEFLGNRLQQRVAYRPTTGVWRLEDTREIGWGSAGDIPVLGDYDGDGVMDIAIYRPTTGAWYVLTSLSGYADWKVFGWGGEGDVPVPGDYDGDGITDVAVYRPSTGTWFLLTSSSNYQQYRIYAWGTAEDVPVVGDYDGDGISDIAVYRASIGAWYIVTSSSNFMGTLSAAWGGGDDIPVPGDYNGDGFTDVAVYRPASGTWFVMGSTPIEWGAAGDVPVRRR